jgi:hypothetical protein
MLERVWGIKGATAYVGGNANCKLGNHCGNQYGDSSKIDPTTSLLDV